MSSFTLSMHVKTTQTSAWKDFVSIGSGNNVVFVLEQTNTAGVYNYNINNVGGTSDGSVGYDPGSPTFAVNDGQWHHVVTTVGAGGQRLHVDGQIIATGKLTARTHTSNRLGLDLGPGDTSGRVALDELRIHGNALTGREIAP